MIFSRAGKIKFVRSASLPLIMKKYHANFGVIRINDEVATAESVKLNAIA